MANALSKITPPPLVVLITTLPSVFAPDVSCVAVALVPIKFIIDAAFGVNVIPATNVTLPAVELPTVKTAVAPIVRVPVKLVQVRVEQREGDPVVPSTVRVPVVDPPVPVPINTVSPATGTTAPTHAAVEDQLFVDPLYTMVAMLFLCDRYIQAKCQSTYTRNSSYSEGKYIIRGDCCGCEICYGCAYNCRTSRYLYAGCIY